MKRAGAIALALALAGCATWQQPGVSPHQAKADAAACQTQVEYATGSLADPIARGVRMGMMHKACMEQRGYSMQATR